MSALLKAERFAAAYGPAPVVQNISLALEGAEIVALMGRNGMGKTTLLRGLMGLTPVRGGKVSLADHEISTLTPEAIARAANPSCSSPEISMHAVVGNFSPITRNA